MNDPEIRTAMIFAAGLGTRLKPLTDNLPKALVNIAGKPLLEHLIIKLKFFGFTRIVINMHHFADMIIDFLKKNNNFDIEILISDERDLLLDTGGGLKNAAPFLKGNHPVLVHNVDIISDVNLNDIYKKHQCNNALATLLVNGRESMRQLFFNPNGYLCGWQNKTTGKLKWSSSKFSKDECKAYAFGGVHVVSPEIFKCFDKWNRQFSIIDFYLDVATTENICAYVPQQAHIVDIGKIEHWEHAEKIFADMISRSE